MTTFGLKARPRFLENVDEPLKVSDDAEDVAVEEDGEDRLVRELFPGQEVNVLDADVECKPKRGRLLISESNLLLNRKITFFLNGTFFLLWKQTAINVFQKH